MKYYKQIKDDYILSIGKNIGGIAIDVDEYNDIKKTIDTMPKKNGFGYILKTDLTWEEYELPIIEESEVFEEATEQDYQNALAQMGVDLNG